jgi:hypothetical protein
LSVIYVKSALVGLLALVIALALLPLIAMFVLMVYGWIHPSPEGYSVGWDPTSLVKQSPWLPLAFIVIVFASGFFWELRRIMHR